MLPSLIQELSKEWELENELKQENPGVYIVPLEENLNFTISSLPQGGIYFNCAIAAIPKGSEEALYTRALLGNLFGQGTKGAVLGLNESGTVLTLSRLIDYDIKFKEFRDLIEDFINSIDFWRSETLNYH